MTLSKKEINGLLRLIGLTTDEEISCDQCLSHVAEFAEQELAGKPISAGLETVRQHLAVCAECREEYELLHQALDEMDG